MDREYLAKTYHKEGLNCAQAVALAFSDLLDLSQEQIKSATIAFGGGFGRQKLVCGAVSAMTFVLGLTLANGRDKLQMYEIEREACSLVKEQIGSLICAELTSGESKKIPCGDICAIVSKITQEIIEKYK